MTTLAIAALALRITLVLGAVGTINLARTRASAANRHWLWMLALAGIVIVPIAARIAPPLRFIPWGASAPIPQASAAATSQASVRATLQDVSPSIQPTVQSAPAIADVSRVPSIQASTLIAVLWAAGSLLLIMRLLRAHIVARRIIHRSSATSIHSVHNIPVRFSNQIEIPFTYGLVHSLILLPHDAASWSRQQMDATIAHETAHALRGDGWALLVSQLVVALYWWHPLVWIAARAAATDRERACDDRVLRDGMRASEYGQCHADRISAWKSSSIATVMFGHSAGLGARISALLDPTVDRSSARPRMRMVVGMLGLAIIAGAASPYSRDNSLEKRIATLTPAFVEASIIPGATPTVPPVKLSVAPSSAVPTNAFSDLNVCQQAKDYRRARTYRDASVHIAGAGSSLRDGVTKEIWTGIDCIGWIQFSGPVDAASGEDDIVVGTGGGFLAHNEGPEGTSEYRVSSSSSSLTLNGQNIATGPKERQFITGMVHEYLRRTGIRARERARIALKSGIPALLTEAAGVPRTNIRVQYLIEGFAATHDAQSVARYIHQGAQLLDSLDSRAPFLVAVPAAYKNDLTVLTAIYEEASVIEPDGAVDEVLNSISPPRPLPANLRPLMEKIIDGISNSDRHAAMRAWYLGIRP